MEKKTSKNILLTIMGVLILAEIVIHVYCCVSGRNVVYSIVSLFALVGVALYGFVLYKKPHGNVLKYSMLLCALAIVIDAIESVYAWSDPFVEVFLPVFAACLMFYVAGRLNRIGQNRYLLFVVAIMLFMHCVINWVSFADMQIPKIVYFAVPGQFITVLTLIIAYFVRFKEHKEAGIIDAPRK